MTRYRTSSLLRLAAILVTLVGVSASTARAQAPPLLGKAADKGFGDSANTYSWSMAWFKGKLYVGTARKDICVEMATQAFYGVGDYAPNPTSDLSCPVDRYDLRLTAQIWQFTPKTGNWTQVYESPQDIPNPRAPGKFVGRDIGFRGMVVHREADGTNALYVGGVTANEYIPEIAEAHPPRILRTTDGTSFAPVSSVPGVITTSFGRQHPVSFRAMTTYKRRLFVTASGGLLGDGVVLEVTNPENASPTFKQVTPPELRVFEMQVFNGYLYIGTGDPNNGYALYKSDLSGPTPSFQPIITQGAGRGAGMTSVVSMSVFKNRLYVGANGWGTLLATSELVRVNPDDGWDLVTGAGRFAPDGSFKFPLTGLPDGFGNFFTSHFWRQQVHKGALYVGTLDLSWGLRFVPVLEWFLRPEFGFDLYGTCDGQFWWRVTRDAFGDGRQNIGARTMASTPAGGFVGSYNPAEGTSVWRSTDPSPCGERAQDGSRAAGLPQAPRKLLADVQRRGIVLSWKRSPGAPRYRVMRSAYRVAHSVSMPKRSSRRAFVPDRPATMTAWKGRTVTDLSVAGRFLEIGTTDRRVFVDRTARRGARYLYQVVATRAGRRSPPSNTVLVPSKRPPVTFAEADAGLRKVAPGRRAALRRDLAEAERRWGRNDRGATMRKLGRMSRAAAARGASDGTAADEVHEEDALNLLMRLERRLRYAGMAGG